VSFKFDIQQYQEECIDKILQIFSNLNDRKNLEEAMKLNAELSSYPQTFSYQKNIDIKMETGTGKTFTFIKSMFELNHKFGYKKFIILIPSIAIREGTKKNLEITKDYFKSYYSNLPSLDKEIEVGIYQNSNISAIERFINDPKRFSVLIMTPDSFNRDKNKINQQIEKDLYTNAKTYLEALKHLNPIIIIDEPHKFEGDAFKKYFSGFNNYFLRFGATFPKKNKKANKSKNKQDEALQFSNIAYILDSISSFRQCLVKRITVFTEGLTKENEIIEEINKEEVRVKKLINGDWQKEALKQGYKFNNSVITAIKKDSILLANGEVHFPQTISYSLSEDDLRFMISRTIKLHFEKEKILFNQGIKALSLFFIRNIADFRDAQNSIVKKIFESEYLKERQKQINQLKNKKEFKSYLQYLEKDFDDENNLKVHKGYFSGDRKNTEKNEQESIDEILKDKEKLLSFESSTRFIFSVWALQEGWDNPNIFTICKLSNYGSENSKLQQIGRGLRICVKKEEDLLIRQTVDKFDCEEDFWQINNLDVVVSSNEGDFVAGIQNEISNNSILLNDKFSRKELLELLQGKVSIAARDVLKFMEDEELIKFIEETESGEEIYQKSSEFSAKISLLKKNPQNLKKINQKDLEEMIKLFDNDAQNFARDGNKIKKKKNLKIKTGSLEKFKELWQAINQKAIYSIKDLNQESEEFLTKKIAGEISKINIKEKYRTSTKHTQNIKDNLFLSENLSDSWQQKDQLNYVGFIEEIADKTSTPLSFILKVFSNLEQDFRKNELAKNATQAKKEIIEIVKNNLVGNIKSEIEYKFIEGEILSNSMLDEQGNFRSELKAGSLGKNQEEITNFSLKEKWIFEDVIEYDSEFEKEIITNDEDKKEITIFAKMPKLEISTPIGKYNPDFCYSIEKEGKKKLFLIVESKGYETQTQIPQNEKDKIYFAKKYFEKLSQNCSDDVVIKFQERINKEKLSDIINQALNHL